MKDFSDFAHNVPFPRRKDFELVVIVDDITNTVKTMTEDVANSNYKIVWSGMVTNSPEFNEVANAKIASVDASVPKLTITRSGLSFNDDRTDITSVYKGVDNAEFDTARKKYNEAQAIQIKELGNYLAEEHGLAPDSKMHKFIFDKAWDEGHSEGRISDIYSDLYDEYHAFMKTMEG